MSDPRLDGLRQTALECIRVSRELLAFIDGTKPAWADAESVEKLREATDSWENSLNVDSVTSESTT